MRNNTKDQVESFADSSGWLSNYLDISNSTYETEDGKEKKLSWKQAAYVAWYSAPRKKRKPGTAAELASLLNYSSDKIFYKWQRRPWFRTMVDGVRQSVYMENLADVDRMTIDEAINQVGRDGVAARKLYYEQYQKHLQKLEPVPDDIDKLIADQLSRLGVDADE